MKQLLRILALSTVILYSCDKSKDEMPVVLEGEYQSGNTILATNPIMMYTKNGSVENQQVINRFLLHRPGTEHYFFRNDVPISNNESFRLIIQSDKSAALILQSSLVVDTIKAEITSRMDDYIVISQLDSVAGPSNNLSDQCTQIANQIKKIYPNKRCINLSPVTGYSRFCTFRPIWVLNLKNKEISVPYFSWLAKSVSNRCEWTVTGEWNTLNPAVTNRLKAGDTIVVQQREIALIRK